MRSDFPILIALLLFLVSHLCAEDSTLSAESNGSYTVEAEIADLGKRTGDMVALTEKFGSELRSVFRDVVHLDYTSGHFVSGPCSLTVKRTDGTVSHYEVDGEVYAFDMRKSFTSTPTRYSLRGVVVFESGEGQVVVDLGTISILR